jgi:hypothetical protein
MQRPGSGARVRSPEPRPNPSRRTPDVVEIDGLEPEEAEVREVHPVAAILVASQVSLPSVSYIVRRYRFGTLLRKPVQTYRSLVTTLHEAARPTLGKMTDSEPSRPYTLF